MGAAEGQGVGAGGLSVCPAGVTQERANSHHTRRELCITHSRRIPTWSRGEWTRGRQHRHRNGASVLAATPGSAHCRVGEFILVSVDKPFSRTRPSAFHAYLWHKSREDGGPLRRRAAALGASRAESIPPPT